jgi:hypothetical protein
MPVEKGCRIPGVQELIRQSETSIKPFAPHDSACGAAE